MSSEDQPGETSMDPAPAVESQPIPESPPPKKSSRLGLLLLSVVAVGGLGFAAAWFDLLKLKGEDPVIALQSQVTDLSTRLAAVDAGLVALTDRVDATESVLAAPAVPPADVDALADRLEAVESALDALGTMPANADGSIPAASFAALVAAVDATKAELAALKAAPAGATDDAISSAVDKAMANWASAQAASAEAEVEAAKARAAQMDAVQRIRAASLSGAPYSDALAALGDLSVDDLIRDKAETGLPTLQQLSDAFPVAARAALDASLRAAVGNGTSDRFFNFLRIQTGARSLEPREGSDPDAILSRAEAALKIGDAATALLEIAALPAEGQAEMAEWSALANGYIAAEKAISALAAAVGL